MEIDASATPPSKSHRFHELDSLRGLAALLVVVHHYLYMYFFQHAAHPTLKLWFIYPLLTGHEAVILFFVLSGFVLSLQYLHGSPQRYGTFLLRRILRLYGPYFFALLLAVACNVQFHGVLPLGKFSTVTWYDRPHLHEVIEGMELIRSYDWGRFNVAFWSLVYEMRVSIIFPLLFLVVRRAGTLLSLLLAVVCCITLHEMSDIKSHLVQDALNTMQYLPIFAFGILLAMNLEPARRWWAALRGGGKWCVFGTAILLYGSGRPIEDSIFPFTRSLYSWAIADWSTAVGSVVLILLAVQSPHAKRFLGATVPAFLGRISYSLYLVHSIVLFAIAFMLPSPHWRLLAFCLYVPATIALATVFCILIEEPFIRLGRKVGR